MSHIRSLYTGSMSPISSGYWMAISMSKDIEVVEKFAIKICTS